MLDCVSKNEYNRDGFLECVLDLYSGKSEKSVFRGMAIPTLRRLGLIVGYEHAIRLSANGKLVCLAKDRNKLEGMRALRAVQYELDCKIAGFIAELLKVYPIQEEKFIDLLKAQFVFADKKGKAISGIPTHERIKDWLSFLVFSELLYRDGKGLFVNSKSFDKVRKDTDSGQKREPFATALLNTYNNVARENLGVRTVEIEELRRAMATDAYVSQNSILTEKQFDDLLRQMPKITDKYTIAFGRSMGAEEKLLQIGNEYYQTISIRFSA